MSPDQGSLPERHAVHEHDADASYRVTPEPSPAKEQVSRWPGWIWAVPIAAVAIVGYLAFKQLAVSGPAVTVTFQTAGGVQAGNTQVKYQGVKVGEVEAVHLGKNLQRVEVRLRMDADMEGHLGSGTEFWIAGQSPSLGNLASLKSIITGPYIGVIPHDGKTQHNVQGLAQQPVTPQTVPGQHYVMLASTLGNLGRGSAVIYHGDNAGYVEQTSFQADGSFRIGVFVKAPYDGLVRTGTRFWDAGAVQLSMQPNGPKLQFQSVSAVLQGAVSFETPAGTAGGSAAPAHHTFTLYSSKQAAEYAPGPNAVRYRVVFQAAAGGLSDGAAVELAGKRVGTVVSSELQYDAPSGQLQEAVTLALEPSRIALTGSGEWTDPRKQMDAMLDKLVSQGLRAQLGSFVPVVGVKDVELAYVAGPSQTPLMPGNPPEIPSASGGGGIEDILTAVNRVTGKLDALPIDQIAANVRTITARAAELAQSSQLKTALQNMDRSVANVERLTASADAQVPAIVAELRRVATQAQATIASARSLLNNQSGVTATGLQTAGLSQTLYELSEAARSVRQLADYLDRHPSALIRGRG